MQRRRKREKCNKLRCRETESGKDEVGDEGDNQNKEMKGTMGKELNLIGTLNRASAAMAKVGLHER